MVHHIAKWNTKQYCIPHIGYNEDIAGQIEGIQMEGVCELADVMPHPLLHCITILSCVASQQSWFWSFFVSLIFHFTCAGVLGCGAASDWPGLCLFCCYQPSCDVSQMTWCWAFFFVSLIFQSLWVIERWWEGLFKDWLGLVFVFMFLSSGLCLVLALDAHVCCCLFLFFAHVCCCLFFFLFVWSSRLFRSWLVPLRQFIHRNFLRFTP